jgi:hypothetical protein
MCEKILRRVLPLLSVLITLFLPVAPVAGAESDASEYQVKAAFLYNFARFVDWPAGSLSDSIFVLGVVGDDPFGSSLDRVVDDKTIRGRNIVVRRYKRASDIQTCHLLFISESERDNVGKILDRVEKRPILTVSEIDGFIARGGMINFTIESKRVRFDINSGAAERVDLRVSARLLQLARNVRR